MSQPVQPPTSSHVTVRFWAGAREAMGTSSLQLPAEGSLADLLAHLGEKPAMQPVLRVASVLLDERPLGQRDPAQISLAGITEIEILPPFAGG